MLHLHVVHIRSKHLLLQLGVLICLEVRRKYRVNSVELFENITLKSERVHQVRIAAAISVATSSEALETFLFFRDEVEHWRPTVLLLEALTHYLLFCSAICATNWLSRWVVKESSLPLFSRHQLRLIAICGCVL